MNNGHKETISTRFISTVFMVLAIAIFKPFGLEVIHSFAVHLNLGQVEQISSNSRAMQFMMRHGHDAIPVPRSNVNKPKELLG